VAPRSHPGSKRRYKEEQRPKVAREHLVERRDVELCGRSEERDPGVVDQDVDLADVACQALHVGDVAEVGSEEAGFAARGGDFLDRLGAAVLVVCGASAAQNMDAAPFLAVACPHSPGQSGVSLDSACSESLVDAAGSMSSVVAAQLASRRRASREGDPGSAV
jgi:hypothetical protein